MMVSWAVVLVALVVHATPVCAMILAAIFAVLSNAVFVVLSTPA
jgi:hypothetical protein